ncbi:hypothetical protein C8R28_102316 [Nitrosomonas ureae]|uniref:Uncharacterized protein n=1 Tax=Nitrosomonas ureae TaxID=44577 RepID=A0A2T5IIG1_9PROT|nr:hypothetical protein C8R28_102316 [Nitrosomonas ureae]
MFARKLHSGSSRSIAKGFVLCVVIFYSTLSFAGGTGWNNSSDPYALYGLCLSGSIGSALGSKQFIITGIGETLTNVLAITVLDCKPFSGGGTQKVACPPDSPYAYCTNTGNDGGGNNLSLGVLKLNAKTDPNGLYTGCPGGAQLKPKLSLIKRVRDPRLIKGAVTLSCDTATVANSTKAAVVDCPTGPDPYDYCLSTPNDGSGNAVTIGVVAAKDAGDPYGLYGECNTTPSAYGIEKGFKSKATLVTSVGLSMDTVRSIDLIGCNAPVGIGSWFPENMVTGSCSEIPIPLAWANRYSYCIWGTDDKGNGVVAGVNQ